jgi:hypothetical protein
MKALIKNNQIVQVSANEFEVHPDYKWMDCPDNCTTEWAYSNEQFIEPVIIPDPVDSLPLREEMIKAMWRFCSTGDKTSIDAIKDQVG